MNASRTLVEARKQARLTQRQLAQEAGVPQSEVARIETGVIVPRVDTFDRLLAACGQEITLAPRLGTGVDRTPIKALLALSPGQRARLVATEANNLQRLVDRGRS